LDISGGVNTWNAKNKKEVNIMLRVLLYTVLIILFIAFTSQAVSFILVQVWSKVFTDVYPLDWDLLIAYVVTATLAYIGQYLLSKSIEFTV
jgi:hypothetical protein